MQVILSEVIPRPFFKSKPAAIFFSFLQSYDMAAAHLHLCNYIGCTNAIAPRTPGTNTYQSATDHLWILLKCRL